MESDSFFLKSPKKAFSYAIASCRGRFYLMYTCVLLGNIFAYSIPYFLSIIADKITAVGSAGYSLYDFSGPIVIIAVVLVVSEVCFRIGHMLEISVVIDSFDRITTNLYEKLLNRPAAYFEDKFSGELSRRVEQIGGAIKFFIEFFPWEMGWPVVGVVMAIVLLSTVNLWLTAVFIAWLIFFCTPSYFLLRWLYGYSKKASEKAADLSGTVVDVLGNIPLVHAFASQQYEYAHYRRYMDATINSDRRSRRIGLVNKFQQGLSVIVLSLSLIITSVFLFTHGAIEIGGFVIIAAIIPSFNGIIWTVGETVTRGITNYGEFKNALESLDSEVVFVKEGKVELKDEHPTITFEHVSFSYPRSKANVLHDFSLTLKAGERIGLVGRSGAGKSTLVKLLLRSYDPSSGKVKIGEEDSASLTLHSLRSNIAFVPQDTALFHRSLFDNIHYAKPTATKEEVIAASKRAHAHDFIEKYPQGYDTLVGERGVKLSGGQRQRIALARAMLKNSPILVLDEATSSLDTESEEIVQKGLQELFEGRTVLAIAHRLSTLRSMDRIIVLEEGRIAEDGAPQVLLAKDGGIFKGMWERQKNGFV